MGGIQAFAKSYALVRGEFVISIIDKKFREKQE